jgi:PAS domain S-box-containing protein
MLLVIGALGAWTLRQVRTSDYWVDHTREVITTNQKLLADVKDAESGERGYMITGDEGYLGPFQTAAADIPMTEAKLHQLTEDNPSQQQRLTNLRDLIASRMDVLDEGVRQRKQSGFENAQQVVIAGHGRFAMQSINDVSQQIEQEEYRLLEQRSQTRQRRIRSGFLATVIAALLALAALLAAPFDVRRAVRQRDAAQQEQHESESRAQALFEAAAQAIVITDSSGKILAANPATQKIFGYSADEIVDQSIEALIPGQLRGKHIEHRQQYFSNPQTREMGLGFDLTALRKDGTEFYAEISLSYIRSSQGVLAVAFVSDVSKRKADEKAIRQKGEELRALAGRLMTAQDDERRRIARDLHDDLSQKLAYLAMDLGKLAGKDGAQEAMPELRILQRRAVEASETVRRISHELHPSILDDIGLEAALEQYCEEFSERSGITTHFTSQNVPEVIEPDVTRSLYHIAQECLRNVSKHANTEKAFVTLEAVGDALRLVVRDEGVGLAAKLASSGKSIGIVGMKERASLVNGNVAIQSRTGKGTEVTVSIPLSPNP